ncbi:hypothetical protein JHK87_035309 [Glycine soja]|nr:hypothetical protein JHK87_035309 [Glycine soja]
MNCSYNYVCVRNLSLVKKNHLCSERQPIFFLLFLLYFFEFRIKKWLLSFL